MAIQPPPEVVRVLSDFDRRTDTFDPTDAEVAVRSAVENPDELTPDARRGWWAECTALAFHTYDASDGGPWKTYFQPLMSVERKDGTMVYCPDLRQVDTDVLDYWGIRAKIAKHPALVARYADLVWDTTEVVTKAKRGRDKFEYVKLAIDAYIATSRMDDGSGWMEVRDNLTRALQLALSVNDATRIDKAVTATIEYVDRTAEDDAIGTYIYLFDNLIPPEKGPKLTSDQQRDIVAMFEAKLAKMSTLGGQWDVDPHPVREIGDRLARFYEREGKPDDRSRVLRLVAQAFERRAKVGDALLGSIFMNVARKYYVRAGLRDEAERVQCEAQKMGPEAEKRLVRTTVEHEIPKDEVDKFLHGMMECGMEKALLRFAEFFVPSQAEIAKQEDSLTKDFPLRALFFTTTKKLGHGHIEADVSDDTADADGVPVFQTTQYIQFQAAWIRLMFERMIQDGLTARRIVEFVCRCPLYSNDRHLLIMRGIEAHLAADYIQAIHLLVPQIERAIVNLLPLVGKPSNKAHRTGRGVMQFKNLNDVLSREEWPIPGEDGECLRVYFLTVLAHPKGLNIRNDVCHGLWGAEQFTRSASERVLHVLFAVSMIRPGPEKQAGNENPGS